MTTRKTKPAPKSGARRLRRHDSAPAGWQFNDGRPRWIPSPALRRAGWRAVRLTDARGRPLTEGQSRDRAREIVAAVAAWRAGEAVPAGFEDCAPEGASVAVAAPRAGRGRDDPMAIGPCLDAWMGRPKDHPDGWLAPSDRFRRLAPSTQRDYRNKAGRLVDTLAGWAVQPERGDAEAQARYAADVAHARAQSIFLLEPVETPEGIVRLLDKAYWRLHEVAGVHQASGVMAVASVWLTWCRKNRSGQIANWAADVERETPPGKIRTRTWPEIRLMIETADKEGWPSIGDAIVLGLDLSWSQVDRLALTWDRVRDGRAFTARQKTGRKGGTPFLAGLGLARLPQIIARQDAMPARPTHVLWCESTGAPWKADHFRHVVAAIRAKAAEELPSVADFVDADLRDTAFTWGREAGLDDDGTASRTIQSRQNIAALGDKHYGEIGPGIADGAAEKLNQWLAKKGVKL